MDRLLTTARVEPRQLGLVFLACLAVSMLVYWQSFGHPWSFDDTPVILQNPDILSLANFFDNVRDGRPVRELSLLLDHSLWGLEPRWWHLQQLFWHALNGALLWSLAGMLGFNRIGAWLAALVFLLHPVQVEVVANLSNRKDSLALCFCLLAAMAYLRFCQTRAAGGWRWLPVALILVLVGCGAKQTAAGVILVFLVVEFLWLQPERRVLLRYPRILAAVIFVGGIAGLIWYAWGGGRALFLQAARRWFFVYQHFDPATEFDQLLMILKSSCFLLLKVLWPFQLAAEYIYAPPASIADPWVIGGVGVWCLFLVLLVVAGRKRSLLLVPLVWLLAFWLPVSNLWPLSYFAADRYLYMPMVGPALLCGWGGMLLWGRGCRRPVLLVAVVLLTGLGLLSFRQNQTWSSPEALWGQAIKVSPESSGTWNNLGLIYLRRGDIDQSIPYFKNSIKFNPYKATAYYNLGSAHEQLQQLNLALQQYQLFLSINAPGLKQERELLRQRLLQQYGVQLR
jgi:hypothetical protein